MLVFKPNVLTDPQATLHYYIYTVLAFGGPSYRVVNEKVLPPVSSFVKDVISVLSFSIIILIDTVLLIWNCLESFALSE